MRIDYKCACVTVYLYHDNNFLTLFLKIGQTYLVSNNSHNVVNINKALNVMQLIEPPLKCS